MIFIYALILLFCFEANAAEIAPIFDKPKAKIAIVIDDLGQNKRTKELLDFPNTLTLAFLPDPKWSKKYALKAHKKGFEILIHMPMEAKNFKKEEESILKTDMNADQIKSRLDDAFKIMPYAVGLNNHTGSKFTNDEAALNMLFSDIKKRRKLFLNSKTVSGDLAKKLAYEHKIPYRQRTVFLDHVANEESIMRSLKIAEKKALKNGYAIAIGHPYPETIKVLREWLATYSKDVFEIVPVSKLY